MKGIKKVLAMLLCLAMVLTYVPVHGFAAKAEGNVTLTANKTEANVDDTIKVYLGNTDMMVSSIGMGFYFDKDLLEVTKITAKPKFAYKYWDEEDWVEGTYDPTSVSTVDEANASGYVGIVRAATSEDQYIKKENVVTVTFTAKAAGTITFTLKEDSAGTDGFNGTWTGATTVTINGASEPACEHTSTTLVPNSNSTHNVVCTNEACKAVVNENVPCTGTDDGDHTTAVMCNCGNVVTAATEHTYTQNLCGTLKTPGDCNTKAVYAAKCDNCAHESDTLTVEGEYGNHDYGTLIPEQEAVHTKDELKPGVDAHYICSKCGKYFTEDKVETDLEALTGETPVHTVDPSKTTTETTKEPTCSEEGTKTTSTFCSCGYAFLPVSNDPIAPDKAYCSDDISDIVYTWADDYSSCKAEAKCEHGTVIKEETVNSTFGVTTEADCQTAEVVTYTADFTSDWAVDQTKDVTGEKNMNKHAGTQTTSYENNGETHTVIVTCSCGGEVSKTEGDHDFNNDEHKCACTAVEMFDLKIVGVNGEEIKTVSVPYGAKILDYVKDVSGGVRYDNWADSIQKVEHDGTWVVDVVVIDDSDMMPAEDVTVGAGITYTGWEKVGGNWFYCIKDVVQKSGWTLINHADYTENGTGSDWYYLDPEKNGSRAEGLVRIPYPANEINGITYGPGVAGGDFIDATEAWFAFNEDGTFCYNGNGSISYGESLEYMGKLVDGMLVWHPGMIEVAPNVYRYFIGNTAIGGNTVANGDTYITRSSVEAFKIGDIYHFTEGALSGYNGVVDGKYYENSRLMVGNGLTKLGDKFIYVRSTGKIVVNADYYVPANDKGIVPGTYHFDENGYLVNPELTSKNGIVSENGGLYFYEDGRIAYNKGLIEFEGNVIYVRSNGQLAVGAYYVTNLANFNSSAVKYGDKVTFGADGCMVAAKNGVVEGKYYVNNQIVYGAGVVEIEEGKYIYVKSDGTVVKGMSYWITNVGDTGVVAKSYTFDENGYFTPEFAADQKSGIVDGYYYQNGKIVYGAGLTAYNDGYIYVRSNGMVATGKYWVTNTNGLLESNYYTFGDDGMMITE